MLDSPEETIDNLKTSLPLKQEFGTGRALLQPITLGTADEIEALIKSIGGDKTYEQNLAQLNLAQRMYEKESPEGATAADVTGTAITFPLLARGMGAGFQKLLPKARKYSNKSGNPIGKAAESLILNNKEYYNWCTCSGSQVCSYYANKFNDGTRIKFMYNPRNRSIYYNVPFQLEKKYTRLFGINFHKTPGIY